MSESVRRFRDVPQFTRSAKYAVMVPWGSIERNLTSFAEGNGIDLDPDFQRAHVWTRDQQVRYVEFVLRGGNTGREILFNQSGWGRHSSKDRGEPVTLVDGKQRLEAVRTFMADGFPVFGSRFSGFEDKLNITGPSFTFHVNDLPTRQEVLQWYVDLNSGGTVHTDEEIAKVRRMIAHEIASDDVEEPTTPRFG